jgi:tRNA pseudouridine38-40 synthase
MKRNVKVVVAYDGSTYNGWQRLPDKKTVQGSIEKTLTKILDQKITIDGAGRTDSGVHAIGQCFSFQYEDMIPIERLQRYMSHKLEDSVSVVLLEEVDESFHARYSAKGKSYIYRINFNRRDEVYFRNYYCFEDELQIEKMKAAAKHLIGEKDFTAFSANGTPEKRFDKVRTIEAIEFMQTEDGVSIRFTGNGFLYRMIRLMMYHLIEVGRGNRPPESTLEILESKSRKRTNRLAPAAGLYLEKVRY